MKGTVKPKKIKEKPYSIKDIKNGIVSQYAISCKLSKKKVKNLLKAFVKIILNSFAIPAPA